MQTWRPFAIPPIVMGPLHIFVGGGGGGGGAWWKYPPFSLGSAFSSRCFRVEVRHKLLVSFSEFSGPRKFTSRYQYFGMKAAGM